MTRVPTRRLRIASGEGSPRTGIRLLPDRPPGDVVAQIALAEDLGFEEVWVGDEGTAHDPFAVLAAAAQATSHIRLGVGVTNPYLRHPVITATTMLTIHELSGGRAVLGVGAGGVLSLKPFEVTPERPEATLRRFLETADAKRRGTEPLLPLYVGARGQRLNQLASELADGAFVSGLPPFRYREVIGWARSVRPVEIALYPGVAFGAEGRGHHRADMAWALLDTPPAVRTRLGVDDLELRAAVAALSDGDRAPAEALITDSLQEQLMLVGEPEEVGQRLAALVREHQPDSIGLVVAQPDVEAGIRQAAEALGVMRRLSATA